MEVFKFCSGKPYGKKDNNGKMDINHDNDDEKEEPHKVYLLKYNNYNMDINCNNNNNIYRKGIIINDAISPSLVHVQYIDNGEKSIILKSNIIDINNKDIKEVFYKNTTDIINIQNGTIN